MHLPLQLEQNLEQNLEQKFLILFHFQTLGAGRHIPNYVTSNIFFLMFHFVCLCRVFLLEREGKCKKLRM